MNFGIQDALHIIIKLTGIIGSILYILFALVMIRQISSMKKVLEMQDRGLLLFTAYIQLIVTIILLLYSLLIL